MSEQETTKPHHANPVVPTARQAGGILHRPTFLCLLLAVVTLVVFWPARNFEFVNFDDHDYVTLNRHVRNGLSLQGVLWALTTGHACNWHPVTWLSHMADASLFGPDASGPHIVNLLFHAANTLLLFLLLQRMTGAHWRSAFVAALFALHPLHVESVAWVSERKDVLSTFFGLLTMWAYARYVEGTQELKPEIQNSKIGPQATAGNAAVSEAFLSRPLSNVWYRWSLALFILGLMSKPMLVTLPFLLLLLDLWPLNRLPLEKWRQRIGPLMREKLPFFAASSISCIITFLVQNAGGATKSFRAFPFGVRLDNAFVSYLRYLIKTFWPVNLAIPYPPSGQWPMALVLVASILIVGASLLAMWLGRKHLFVPVGWFWFLGTLLPVIGLVQVGVQSMADRYSYIPLIGIFILLAWSAGELWSRRRFPGVFAGVIAVVLLFVCALRTRDQLSFWRNSETLFAHSIAATPGNFRAHANLGLVCFQKGRIEEALEHYHESLAIWPEDPTTLNDLGSALFQQNKVAEAIQCYESALRYCTNFPSARNNLGVALERTGHPEEAKRCYEEALRLDPDNAQAHNNLANMLAGAGQLESAAKHYLQAIEADPALVEAYNNLGWVLAARGQYVLALEYYQQALQLRPENAVAHKNAADALVHLGRKEDAVAEYTEALKINPDYSEARTALQILIGPQTN